MLAISCEMLRRWRRGNSRRRPLPSSLLLLLLLEVVVLVVSILGVLNFSNKTISFLLILNKNQRNFLFCIYFTRKFHFFLHTNSNSFAGSCVFFFEFLLTWFCERHSVVDRKLQCIYVFLWQILWRSTTYSLLFVGRYIFLFYCIAKTFFRSTHHIKHFYFLNRRDFKFSITTVYKKISKRHDSSWS